MKKKTTVKQNYEHKCQGMSPSENKRRRQVKTPELKPSNDRFTRSCKREDSEKLGALPNVTVLMSGKSRQQRTNPGNVDVFGEDNFTGSKSVTAKPYCNGDTLSQSFAEQTSYLYGSAQASLLYRGGDKSEAERVTVVERVFKTEANLSAHDVISPVSETKHQSEERGTFVEHGEYTNLLAAAVNLEPLTPAHVQVKGQFYPQDVYHGVSNRLFQVHSGVADQWGQENERYSDIRWKHQENNFVNHDYVSCVTNSAATPSNTTANNNNNNDTHFLNGNIKHDYIDETADSYSSQAYLSDSSSTVVSTENGRRRRKRIQTPNQRSAANMRERRRMCHLNVAFDRLKEHLPNVKDKKKLSRIQTLKAAIYYIHLLQDSLTIS